MYTVINDKIEAKNNIMYMPADVYNKVWVFLCQVLQYMCTACTVASPGNEKQEVVAIVFEDVASVISVPSKIVKDTILSVDIGKTRKDFLSPTADITLISRRLD